MCIGHCQLVNHTSEVTYCQNPRSSVLLDSVIPTLSGLDGNQWARQLLTINIMDSAAEVTFDFTTTGNYVGVMQIEVVMFNCPQWRIGTNTVSIYGSTSVSDPRRIVGYINSISATSCTSLVRVCTDVEYSTSLPVLTLHFPTSPGLDWTHIAEVVFSSQRSQCLPGPIIVPPANTTDTTGTYCTPKHSWKSLYITLCT